MIYAATKGVIIYWKPDQYFVIYIYHHVWFYEHNYSLSIENKHNPGFLLLQQDPESIIHNLDLFNLITCEIDLTATPFSNTTILTYDIELPPYVKKIDYNLLDDEYFTIQNSPASHQL